MSPTILRNLLYIARSQGDARTKRNARRHGVSPWRAMDIMTRKATREDFRRLRIIWQAPLGGGFLR